MPVTVFAIKGICGNRRERIEAAVAVGGRNAAGRQRVAASAPRFAYLFPFMLPDIARAPVLAILVNQDCVYFVSAIELGFDTALG